MNKEQVQEKVRENRIRRAAKRQGLELMKARRRDPLALNYKKYMLRDVFRNVIAVGNYPHEYSMSLDEVERWLQEPRDRR